MIHEGGEGMPKDFDMCVQKGGRVRTIKVGGDKYRHICYMDGKSYAGEVKTKQPTKEE